MHHDKDHHHHHESDSVLSFEDKLKKLLEHWMKHNDDHIKNYQEWTAKIIAADIEGVGDLLKEAAELTRQINGKFQQALDRISK